MKAKKVVHRAISLHDMTWYNSWQAGGKSSKTFAVLCQSSETLEEKNSVLDSQGHTHTHTIKQNNKNNKKETRVVGCFVNQKPQLVWELFMQGPTTLKIKHSIFAKKW